MTRIERGDDGRASGSISAVTPNGLARSTSLKDGI
jgi:hypothetical protein